MPQQQLWAAAPPGGALSNTHPLLFERDVRHSLHAHGAATAPPAGRPDGTHSRAARRAAPPRVATRGQQRGRLAQVRCHGLLETPDAHPARGDDLAAPPPRRQALLAALRSDHGGCGAVSGAAARRRKAGKQRWRRRGAGGQQAAGCAGAPPSLGSLLPARDATDTDAGLCTWQQLGRRRSSCEHSARVSHLAAPTAAQVIGMAGSGKTSFMQRMNAHYHAKVRAVLRRVPAQQRRVP